LHEPLEVHMHDVPLQLAGTAEPVAGLDEPHAKAKQENTLTQAAAKKKRMKTSK
jgi:hypothetical protein